MRGGRLRRVVTIQAPTVTQTGTGAVKTTGWAAIANGSNIYADIDETTGKEQIQAGQINPLRPVAVTIRYLAGVIAEQRVVYGARTFQIVSVLNLDQRNRTLILTCLEHAP
jgi:SPP1 family predicted phage head-tail adaptor